MRRFTSKLGRYDPGTRVRLPDGRLGIIERRAVNPILRRVYYDKYDVFIDRDGKGRFITPDYRTFNGNELKEVA